MSSDLEKQEDMEPETVNEVIDSVENEQTQYDEETLKAIENGYDPDYKGTPEKPAKTAQQYNLEGEKIGLKKQVREKENALKSMEVAMKQILHQQKTLEQEIRNRVLNELEEKKSNAKEMGDISAYEKYTNEYNDYNQKIQQAKDDEVNASDQEHLNSFLDRNKAWFNKDSVENLVMANDATETEKLIRSHNPNLPLDEVLIQVEDYIKSKYDSKFKSQVRGRDNPLVPGRTRLSGSASCKATVKDLTADQKKDLQMFKNSIDVFDENQYVDSLVEMGLVPGFSKGSN